MTGEMERDIGGGAPAGILVVADLVRGIQGLAAGFAAVTAAMLQQEGLATGQRGVLVCLRRQGPMTMAQLARALGVSRQHVRTLVHPLVDRRLLGLQPNPDHKRAHLAELTQDGQELVKRLLGREGEVLARLEQGLTAEGVRTARGVLAALEAALDPVS